jgi:chromosome segregation ATPase
VGFSTLHSRLLSDQTQLKDDVDMLRRENGKLRRERNLLQQSWEDMKRLREEDQKEIGDLRAQQQQVGLRSWGQAKVGHLPAHHPSALPSIPSFNHLFCHPK